MADERGEALVGELVDAIYRLIAYGVARLGPSKALDLAQATERDEVYWSLTWDGGPRPVIVIYARPRDGDAQEVIRIETDNLRPFPKEWLH